MEAIELILNERAEDDINSKLAELYLPRVRKIKQLSGKIDTDDIRRVRFQLEALGLIRAISRQRQHQGITYSDIVWTITDKGRRYMSQNLAIFKSQHGPS